VLRAGDAGKGVSITAKMNRGRFFARMRRSEGHGENRWGRGTGAFSKKKAKGRGPPLQMGVGKASTKVRSCEVVALAWRRPLQKTKSTQKVWFSALARKKRGARGGTYNKE